MRLPTVFDTNESHIMYIDLSGKPAVVSGSTAGIGRAIATEDVPNLVVNVCSPQASARMGAALRVDGGMAETIA
ncbi:hypothetical protein BSLA_03r1016 [Burkholderia stabilis]|nr:hypothetical protein BSLA_03r1016 [Burkholderia stabilis]